MGVLPLGLVWVTGEHDTGKTNFAIECGAKPERMFFIDDDIKSRSIAQEMKDNGYPFGKYVNAKKDFSGFDEFKLHDAYMTLIDSIKPGQFDAIIFDTWQRFEQTLFPVVEKTPLKFRTKYSAMGTIKGAQQWQASFEYESSIISGLVEKAPLVILTSHLKNHTVGNIRTGKKIPDIKKPIEIVSNLRLWLRHNPDSPKPIGLILKRLSKHAQNKDGGIQTISVLPRKMNPCTWERIKYYWDNPVGDRVLAEGELPSEFEFSILEETLTVDQKMVMKIASIFGDGVGESDSETEIVPEKIQYDPAIVQQIKTMKQENKNVAYIAMTLKMTPAEVARILLN